MAQVAGGDAHAFAELYKKYAPIITAYVISLKGRRTSLEDIVQEVFARLWQNGKQFRKDSTVKNYLYGIVRNVLADESKRMFKKELVELDALLEPLYGASEPDPGLGQVEIEDVMEQAISKLTESQKEAIRLFYYQGMTSVEVAAKKANCSAEAFRSRLRRAHRRLYRHLGPLKL
jgi:RNA polymerase sigma-70 factor (ECF subfamily)